MVLVIKHAAQCNMTKCGVVWCISFVWYIKTQQDVSE